MAVSIHTYGSSDFATTNKKSTNEKAHLDLASFRFRTGPKCVAELTEHQKTGAQRCG